MVSAVVANSTIPLLVADAFSPDISPLLISIPSPAENLLLTSDVLNWLFVSVDAIVTAPPDSVIVTFEPAVNAKGSEPPNVFPPAVTVLNVFVSGVVTEPPKEIAEPLIVIELFTNSAFATPPSFIVTAPLETEKLSELNDAIPLFEVLASSPLISPLLISIPSPAENLLLTSEVDNWVLVSVEAIVTVPPLSDIDTLLPALNANVSPLANVLPPAVTVLGAVR